jgi:WD40 repeat protein
LGKDVLKAHDKPITKMQWFDANSILMTGSKDKSIKAWKFPGSWRDKKLVEAEELDEQIQQKTESIIAM